MEIRIIDRENVIFLVNQLKDFEKDKAIRSGLQGASNVFVRKGRSNLRARLKGTGDGSLAGSFTTRLKRHKLGVLSGFRRSTRYAQYKGAGNHAHLVDKGTIKRKHPITGTSGVMPANNFWSDAQQTEENKAMQILYNGVQRAVQRINERR